MYLSYTGESVEPIGIAEWTPIRGAVFHRSVRVLHIRGFGKGPGRSPDADRDLGDIVAICLGCTGCPPNDSKPIQEPNPISATRRAQYAGNRCAKSGIGILVARFLEAGPLRLVGEHIDRLAVHENRRIN